jgi:hypothetical protein
MATVREGIPESFKKGFHGAFMARSGEMPEWWKAASKAMKAGSVEMLPR